jgi:hypothetical protein
MKLLPTVAGEPPAVWHLVMTQNAGDVSPFPPIKSYLATESEIRKAVEQFRRDAMKGAR